jgi:hypothetical protein
VRPHAPFWLGRPALEYRCTGTNRRCWSYYVRQPPLSVQPQPDAVEQAGGAGPAPTQHTCVIRGPCVLPDGYISGRTWKRLRNHMNMTSESMSSGSNKLSRPGSFHPSVPYMSRVRNNTGIHKFGVPISGIQCLRFDLTNSISSRFGLDSTHLYIKNRCLCV